MTLQLPFDFAAPTGRDLRDHGIRAAIEHTEQFHKGWSKLARGYLLEFLTRHTGEFMGEDVRVFADAAGCPKPLHARAWGSVMQRAAKDKLIRKVRLDSVKTPTSHCANASVWVRA